MPDWSIKIVPSRSQKPGVLADFQPDIDGQKPGQPLKVQTDDLVSWNNTTAQDHWPWPVVSQDAPPTNPPPNGKYLVMVAVKPGSPSPAYNVGATQGTTLFYCCKLHPAERGQMVVVGFGDSAEVA
jgi:hypothetical protein